MPYNEVSKVTLDSGQTVTYSIDYSGELPDLYVYEPFGSTARIPEVALIGTGLTKWRVINADGSAFCNTFAPTAEEAARKGAEWFAANPGNPNGFAQ